MNILLSVDNNFIDYTKTTITSILMNAKCDINFYILTNSKKITEKNFNMLKHIRDCNITVVQVPDYYYSVLQDRKIFQHLTVATYFRHFAPFLIQDIDKAIYIDSDTLVLKDLQDLFNIHLFADEYCRGVEDCAAAKKMKMWGLDRYINAGVILMNFEYARSEDSYFLYKLNEFYRMYGDKTISGDQDMLNFVFRPQYLPMQYNLYHPYFTKAFVPISCSMETYKQVCKDPSIIHFVGPHKPWCSDCRHPYKDRWQQVFKIMKSV